MNSLLRLFFFFGFTSILTFASPGEIDLSFDPGSAIDGRVNRVYHQPDGNIFIAGNFFTVNSLESHGFARLLPNGATDTTFKTRFISRFNFGSGAYFLPDGKMLLFGSFGVINGVPRSCIVRVHSDGSVDESFGVNGVADATIHDLAFQPDGKMIIVGAFTRVNGVTCNRVARLNADGSLDPNFSVGIGPNFQVTSVAVQADGRILIAGAFTKVQLVDRSRMARLFSNGALDTSYGTTSSGPFGDVYDFVFVPGESTVVGGAFNILGGNRYAIGRVAPNGRGDLTFGYEFSGAEGSVTSIEYENDGSLLVAGPYVKMNGVQRAGLSRLTGNGQLVPSDFANLTTDGALYCATQLGTNSFVIGGQFTHINGSNRVGIAKVTATGDIDNSFANGRSGVNNLITAIATQRNGAILVGGDFDRHAGVPQKFISRLNHNGTKDPSFVNSLAAFSGTVRAVAEDNLGRIFVAGRFWNPGGPYYSLARLSSTGSLDGMISGVHNPFTAELVWCLAVQPDNKLLAGGNFAQMQGLPRHRLARFNPDGGLDPEFDPAAGLASDSGSAFVSGIAVQPDGKIVVVGGFSIAAGQRRQNLARFNSNGALDLSFGSSTNGLNGELLAVALQKDGKILIGGHFTMFQDQVRNGIARLNSDGSIDESFVGPRPNGGVDWLVVEPTGKIIFGQGNALRLNSDGTPDDTFLSPNQGIICGAVQSDGRIVLAGGFTSVNGVARDRIVRLWADHPRLILEQVGDGYLLKSQIPSGSAFKIQSSNDLTSNVWTDYAEGASDGQISIPIAPNQTRDQLFLRVLLN